jgi:hypothetical protein
VSTALSDSAGATTVEIYSLDELGEPASADEAMAIPSTLVQTEAVDGAESIASAFVHDTIVDDDEREMCMWFLSIDGCDLGERCPFKHPAPPSVMGGSSPSAELGHAARASMAPLPAAACGEMEVYDSSKD